MRYIPRKMRQCIAGMLAFIMTFTCLFLINWGSAGNVQASDYYTGRLDYSYAQQVAAKVNGERQKNGVAALSLDEELTEAAMIRAAEVAYMFETTRRLEHTRPNGTSCFTVLDGTGWYSIGENIAYGYLTPDNVMKGWMNSSGHRRNILDADFNAVGVGCFYYNGSYYWVQIFAKKQVSPYTYKDNQTKQVYISTSQSGTQSYILDSVFDDADDYESEADIGVVYSTHIQTFGWSQGYVANGAVSGSEGLAKRLEAIRISLVGTEGKDVGIRYQTHVQSYGWQGWCSNGALSGTSGEAKRLEAIRIELTGSDKNKYDIYYRVHAQSYGWLGWAKNGEAAGTAGQSKRLEAIQIKIVPKGKNISDITTYSFVDYGNTPSTAAGQGTVIYTTHVQSYGWQQAVQDGSVSGTFGQAKRLEGIKINLNTNALGKSGGITYSTHVQGIGWQSWVSNGAMSGTSGQAKRLEAIKIQLTGQAAQYYDVYYRVHAQSYGWLGWAKNGEAAGTSGQAKRLEAIQIVVVPKGQSPTQFTSGGLAYIAR